jgi:predicted dehydrogenase
VRLGHIWAWQKIPGVEVVAVADIIPERAREMAEEYHVTHAVDSHRKLLKVPGIDVVDVCTPNRSHTPIVLDALAAGKHVLCEKPLAVTPAEIEKMIAAARKARRRLCVVQNHRYRNISQAIRKWIDAGNLGEAYYARAWAIRRNLLPGKDTFISRKRSGGGPCMDIGVHCLDLIMWLMGFPEPVSVSGAAADHLAHKDIMPGGWGEWDRDLFDVEDFAVGMVRFKNGAMLSLEATWLAHVPDAENFSGFVMGEKAGVSWPGGVISTAHNGALINATVQPVPTPDEGHPAEIRAFHDAVVNGGPVPVAPEESLKVIRILDGIYRSQKLGREVKV